MIHRVLVTQFSPEGHIAFELGGQSFRARHMIPPDEADGVVITGRVYPLELTITASKPVEYLNGSAETLELIKRDDHAGTGDLVRARGRIMDYIAHDMIRLDGVGTVAVKLTLPQQSTDYRRGSYLEAEGHLSAAMPPPDHDEAGLKGSIVE
jgi:hypothetical protein